MIFKAILKIFIRDKNNVDKQIKIFNQVTWN